MNSDKEPQIPPRKAPIPLGKIAEYLDAEILGNAEELISRVAPIERAGVGEITFLSDPKKARLLRTTKASALIVPRDTPPIEGKTVLLVDNPYVAFARAQRLFFPGPFSSGEISPLARIHAEALIGEGVEIQAFACVEKGARIGKGSILFPHTYIGENVVLGERCVLYPGVKIYHDCHLGDRVILHGGVVIGSDGFGYAWDGKEHLKIPQVGRVVIGNDVEIGSNTTVDRGTLEDTVIGNDVKIDNLVQIGHNVHVGDHTILIAQVGIAGSTELGQGVILAGQVGVAGHLKIGNQVKVAAQAGIHKDAKDGEILSGSPAIPFKTWMKMVAAWPKVPELRRKIKHLEEHVKEMEKRMERLAPGGDK